MKKLVLTTLAENELKNLVKIQDQLEDSDIDLYFDLLFKRLFVYLSIS